MLHRNSDVRSSREAAHIFLQNTRNILDGLLLFFCFFASAAEIVWGSSPVAGILVTALVLVWSIESVLLELSQKHIVSIKSPKGRTLIE